MDVGALVTKRPGPFLRRDMEAILVLPDIQHPLHDQAKLDRVIKFIHQFQPSQIGCVGDFTDSTEISRWTRGLRGEFSGGLENGFQKSRDTLEQIRSGYDGPFHLVRSNHDDRLANAIEQRLPGFAEITIGGQTLNIQNALQLDKYGVTWHDEPCKIAPGWLLMHGDEGKLSQIPGNTALGLAHASGQSVVCGHTHRAGLVSSTRGFGSARTPIMGLEVGHLMNVSKADYLGPARFNNWANGFGILWLHKVPKKKIQVYPELVPILPDGSFQVSGLRF